MTCREPTHTTSRASPMPSILSLLGALSRVGSERQHTSDNPCALVGRDAEVAGDGGYGDVRNGRIQNLHERRHCEREKRDTSRDSSRGGSSLWHGGVLR